MLPDSEYIDDAVLGEVVGGAAKKSAPKKPTAPQKKKTTGGKVKIKAGDTLEKVGVKPVWFGPKNNRKGYVWATDKNGKSQLRERKSLQIGDTIMKKQPSKAYTGHYGMLSEPANLKGSRKPAPSKSHASKPKANALGARVANAAVNVADRAIGGPQMRAGIDVSKKLWKGLEETQPKPTGAAGW